MAIQDLDTLHSYDPIELLRTIWMALKNFLNGEGFLGGVHDFGTSIQVGFPHFSQLAYETCLFTSAVLAWGLIYYSWKIWLLHEEDKKFAFASDKAAEDKIIEAAPNKMKLRWAKVLEHIESEDSGSWKLAILEADIMLDEMLDKHGYHGESIGDKLKQVEKSDFNTIDDAWEAHKIRNQIAHEGSDFILTQRRAKEVIMMFERVFKEFFLI